MDMVNYLPLVLRYKYLTVFILLIGSMLSATGVRLFYRVTY
jgi:hypothetical protein